MDRNERIARLVNRKLTDGRTTRPFCICMAAKLPGQKGGQTAAKK